MRHIKEFNQLFESTRELTLEQKDWLDKCTKGTYSFNPKTGLVDVDESFNCSRQGLSDFKGVRFGYVRGSFICFSNRLTSLEGAPQQVDGDFDCEYNSLTSLDGAPQRIRNSFYCSNNQLSTLKGSPRYVGVYFRCGGNQLTSLEGAPQKVGVDFSCYDNPITEWSIEGILREMSREKITLEQAVKELWKDIPEEDRIYLAKHNPDLSPEEKGGYQALERHKKRLI